MASAPSAGAATATMQLGRPHASQGVHRQSAYPQVRLVGLVETGTHLVFATALGPYATSEVTLAADVLPALTPGMLCPADRFFPSFDLWQAAPAAELAALYHERWEVEGAFDELKTHLKGAQVVLRSRTPELVRQEVYRTGCCSRTTRCAGCCTRRR